MVWENLLGPLRLSKFSAPRAGWGQEAAGWGCEWLSCQLTLLLLSALPVPGPACDEQLLRFISRSRFPSSWARKLKMHGEAIRVKVNKKWLCFLSAEHFRQNGAVKHFGKTNKNDIVFVVLLFWFANNFEVLHSFNSFSRRTIIEQAFLRVSGWSEPFNLLVENVLLRIYALS